VLQWDCLFDKQISRPFAARYLLLLPSALFRRFASLQSSVVIKREIEDGAKKGCVCTVQNESRDAARANLEISDFLSNLHEENGVTE
jgi:hypothetical protein